MNDTAAPATGSASALNSWVAALGRASEVDTRPDRTFPDVIDDLAVRFGDAPALLSRVETYSFRELAERSNRYSRWALAEGLAQGDAVALLMPNRPDYLAAWIGLSRVGIVVALLNTNLTGRALAHCVKAAVPLRAIVSSALLTAWRTAEPFFETSMPSATVDPDLSGFDGAPLTATERRPIATADRALLIYTSGTTGLPKAAHVSHHRVMMWSHWFAGMMGTTATDRMYDCLPLYHSVGGVVATGAVLLNGGSVVIAEKFSARTFWDDVVANECTLFQYIGELCRYLLKSPPAVAERRHKLRLVCGNGLRPDVWEAFTARFAIPRVLEFYAATEGNFSLYNVEGKPGAIGRIPSFMAARFSAAIVRHDPATELPLRDEAGLCIRCARDEPGEAIGRISADEAARAGRFEGYTTQADSDRKILRDVFKPGDAWFRTGDLMRMDRQGYFYFVDRIGDTFRWKGENVATTEVAEAVASAPGVTEAMVYGVPVPGHDGKAGMAAIVVDESFDVMALRAHLTERLPAYARPLFLRICERFEVTETFKQKKGDLARAGFDPAVVSDPLWVFDATQGADVPLDAARFRAVVEDGVKL